MQQKTAPQKTANLEAEQMLARTPEFAGCKVTKNNPMVEKKSAISYESIMKDLKARKYSPVYVLMGEEPFYIDKICDYISENVLQPEERDFNQTVVFGADVTGAQVADLCKGYPMMSE